MPLFNVTLTRVSFQFVQRQRALSLWRDIVRATNSTKALSLNSAHQLKELIEIPPSSTRDEMREFARAEFERYRNVHDLVSIDALWLHANLGKALMLVTTESHSVPDLGTYIRS